MKIFIDTANVEEIREAASWGILDGVTTNPSLIAKEGRDLQEAQAGRPQAHFPRPGVDDNGA